MTDRPDRSSEGFKTNPQLEENKRLLFEIMAEKEARAEAMPTEADAMRTAIGRSVYAGWSDPSDDWLSTKERRPE